MSPMQVGVVFANAFVFAEPENAVAMAQGAEEAGFESLWTVEHVVVPLGYSSKYPYSETGRMPGPENVPIPDPLIWLSWAAGVTRTIKLATGVMILPQRSPVVTAKEVATLDRLSGGRVILGVGAGWLEEEYQSIGVPFEERGRRLDEAIGVLRQLWTGEPSTHQGEFYSYTDAICSPTPVDGSVPIVIGGHSRRAARRAGELGDGFFPGLTDAEELGIIFEQARRAAKDAGRDPDALELTAGAMGGLDGIRRLADMGVSRVLIPPPAFDPEGLRTGLARYGDEVISKLN